MIAIDNVVLLPHVGSGSLFTRAAMDQLVVDNLLAWATAKRRSRRLPRRPGGRGGNLLRGEADFRRGGAHVGVDMLLELDEVLLEHGDQLARRLVSNSALFCQVFCG